MDLKQLQVKPADRELVRSIRGVQGGWPPGGGVKGTASGT